jgi:hypothetical protein
VHRTPSLRTWLVIALIATATAAPAVRAQSGNVRERSPVVVEVHRDGFHWGDAGIGAAAALATVAIAAGAAALIRGRTTRNTS